MDEFPIEDEPPLSDILDEDSVGHKSFSDILMTAPYRGWHSRNFSKLQGYIAGTYDTQREHLWELREDPDYFADTIREHEEHAHYSDFEQFSTVPNKSQYRRLLLGSIVKEAYSMLGGWRELYQRFAEFDNLFREDSNIHDQIHAVYEVKNVAEWMKTILSHKIAAAARSARNTRRLVELDFDEQSGQVSFAPRNACTTSQTLMIKMLDGFNRPETLFTMPAILSCTLETIDLKIRSSAECKAMMSGRLLSLLTDLSIIGECLRQIELWEQSPEVIGCEHEGCEYVLNLDGHGDFLKWMSGLDAIEGPMHHVYPFQEKLYYPSNKRRTRAHVQAMRQAEANLDKFWASVDALYEGKTGIPQHPIIRECLEDSGEIQRTPAWDDTAITPAKKPEHEYQPLSLMAHDKTLQITGAFDKMSVEDKCKKKTRGAPSYPVKQNDDAAVLPTEHISKATGRPFFVDQRTHKVFKTLFYTPTSGTGDLPKAVKWADFKRAMVRVGFTVEKLQGSAWQFTPSESSTAERNIQFHEPHPDSDIPYVMAKRFGRRLARVYGWSADMFKLA